MASNDNDNDVTTTEEQAIDDNYEDEEFEDDEEYEDGEFEDEEEPQQDGAQEEDFNEEDNLFADDDDGAFDDADDGDFDDDDGGWGDDADNADIADINNDDNIMSGAKQNQFESTIPEVTTASINSNCDEINMIPLFAASPDLKSRSRIGAMVGIRVANLTNITTEQLEV